MSKNKSSKYVYLDSDLAWEYIENGKDLDKLFPDKWITKHKFPEHLLIKGEQYKFLEDNLSDYAITSFGRIFSFAQSIPKSLMPNIYSFTVGIQLRGKRVNIPNKMKEYNWPTTFEEIRYLYTKHKWPYYLYISEGNKETYKVVKYETETK